MPDKYPHSITKTGFITDKAAHSGATLHYIAIGKKTN